MSAVVIDKDSTALKELILALAFYVIEGTFNAFILDVIILLLIKYIYFKYVVFISKFSYKV
tara:strand:- start:1443 stop:1625 length:183 start_codon:yes stop_codon:yes gene_type:complete